MRVSRIVIVSVSCGLFLAQLLVATAASAGDPAKEQASQQMKWGFKAARRGYWLEALDRFERANALTPGQARILNNIAVALEASGRFEEALLAYQTALQVAPNDRVLRRNFGQFKEFYDTQVAVEASSDDADEDQEKAANESNESAEGVDNG